MCENKPSNLKGVENVRDARLNGINDILRQTLARNATLRFLGGEMNGE